jgi:hypothetical protein
MPLLAAQQYCVKLAYRRKLTGISCGNCLSIMMSYVGKEGVNKNIKNTHSVPAAYYDQNSPIDEVNLRFEVLTE